MPSYPGTGPTILGAQERLPDRTANSPYCRLTSLGRGGHCVQSQSLPGTSLDLLGAEQAQRRRERACRFMARTVGAGHLPPMSGNWFNRCVECDRARGFPGLNPQPVGVHRA